MERLGDFAHPENLDLVVGAVDEALALEGGFVDGGTRVKQIVEFADNAANEGKIVIISSLNGQCIQKPFDGIA